VGSTPGLQVNYQERILRLLNEQNATILPEQIAIVEAKRIVCVGWRKLLEREQNVFVVHDSLLPKFRGWNPLVTAIEFGFEESGLTLFQASSEVDAGPIIAQRTCAFPPDPSIKIVLELAGEVLAELLSYYSRA
jgi:methionyl-tRNA formyltransferase